MEADLSGHFWMRLNTIQETEYGIRQDAQNLPINLTGTPVLIVHIVVADDRRKPWGFRCGFSREV